MKNLSLAFVGGGNMTRCLLAGVLEADYQANKIWVCDPNPEKLQSLTHQYGVHVTDVNQEAIANAEVIVFAVKPQNMQAAVMQAAAQIRQKKPLIISVAAGVTTAAIQNWLGFTTAVIRCIPNTPAMVGSGATGLYANEEASEEQRQIAESLLRSVGIILWLETEAQLNTVTALSGSGPAYFFLVMESLQQAAEEAGLSSQQAKLLTIQTALGSARLALETEHALTELRDQVTSPGGTTEQGVAVLEAGGLAELFAKALQAARQRAIELSNGYS